ncbi:amidohydrolase family protein [Neobacillus niacini]|uniref:amidohydrolase family protein n=1 Tax=Neobacillus niacini TaxID=86668 RepID=UPI00052FD3D5|nr:amidohydrolase family protein [Neobacillus niacini]KGM46305.1 metal-dependent hydrolase [Neobacillus niacini]MEC1523838.1 amidohydrolase family protein [Neobacillus niacini]
MKIYDVHSHLGKTSSGEENTPTDIVEELGRFGITKIGISSLSGISTRQQNDTIYNAMQEYPGIIEGYGFINPKAPDAIEEVHRCLGEYKMNGIKFHSWKHGYYPDNTPSLNDIFFEIAKYGVHVQTHVGTAPLATPYVWADYAKKFPNIDFLFTHTGYYEFGLSSIEAVKSLDNVWVETSGQMNVEVLKKSVEILGPERVVFGVDWPYKLVNIELEKFWELNIPEDQLEYIFHKNAEYLWRF